MVRKLAIRASIGRAEHGDGDGVADLEIERARRFDVEADQRRAGVIGRPPFARDDLVAFGQVAGEGQAAIAAQDPGAFGNRFELGNGLAVQRRHRAAQRGDEAEIGAGQIAGGERPEARLLGCRNVEHEQRRRLGGDRAAELRADAAADAGQRDQQGKAEAERDA